MATLNNITRIQHDTRRIVFHIVSKDSPTGVNIAGWSGWELVIDSRKNPTDTTTLQATLSGTIEDAATGRVSFTTLGTVSEGKYYYNMRGVDTNGERITLSAGTFTVQPSMP